jgi:protein-ribulosamine 3-kinase
MANAEFEAEKAISAIIPDNVVKPIAAGVSENDSSKAFFISRFRTFSSETPSPRQLVSILKKLHGASVSPTGKFGFHVTTYWGPAQMVNDWVDTWEEYYARQFRSDIAYAQKVFGEDPELQELADLLEDKVIARLLRPLQTGGRSIKPSLCHGDLWDGNVHIDMHTREPVLFDSCAFYGHNEVDLQAVGHPRYVLGIDFVNMYREEVGASEPQEDFYDRHDLYAM